MNRQKLSVVIGLAGLGLAWYWSRANGQKLSALLASIPQRPILIGGSGIPPVIMDPNGDTTARLGTDPLLAVLDPSDPTLYEPGGPFFTGPIDATDPNNYDPGGPLFVGPVLPAAGGDWYSEGVG